MSALEAVLQKRLAGASLAEALAELTADNPELAALTQALALREQQVAMAADDDDQVAVELDAREQVDVRYEMLQARLEEITADVGRLQDTLEFVAAALGACPVCLGGDEGCLLCRGRGSPGSLPPDPVAFDQMALPAVRARAFARSRRLDGHTTMAQSSNEPTERNTP